MTRMRARSVTSAMPTQSGANFPRAWPYWWDVVFLAVLVTVALVVAVLNGGSRAFVALGILAIAWPLLGRKPVVVWPHQQAARSDGRTAAEPYFWHGVAFMFLMALCLGVLSATVPTATFFLIFGCPYAWSWAEGDAKLPTALISNVLICTTPVIGLWSRGGWSGGAFFSALASGLVSFLFSFMMGMWILRISREAEERGHLRAELEATNLELLEAHRQTGAALERERFAHEIHDTLTQTLTAVVMLTERARGELEHGESAAGAATLANAERTARQALAETRSLIAEGRGTGVGTHGFARRITDLCMRFGEESSIHTETQIDGDLDSLTRPNQVVLLRCLQELLSNVRKHARAGNVVVELSDNYLAVTDDGVGFPDGVDAATERGYGLAGIASRLALASGTLTVTTGDEGTRVSITLAGPSTGNAQDA